MRRISIVVSTWLSLALLGSLPPASHAEGNGEYRGGRFDSSPTPLTEGELLWNKLLGGGSYDNAFGVVGDTNGGVYVAGRSDNTWGSPIRAYSGGTDAFVAKVDENGSLLSNLFLPHVGWGIAADTGGNVYVEEV
ncbi:MAG: hypothetical protein HYX75_03765 [Acidobacteria bacterium]|nr:hypothetical protein [Acidobacteriota bacterium]